MYKNNQIYYIQYLRALSVLLVFFYHLKFEIFQNGYLGVDVFFVISGYVITSRLYEDFKVNKTISLKNFFIKRFKRIYPILLVFLFITFIVITILSPLEYLLDRINTLFFALLGISNFFYLFSNKDYFDTIFEDPLNHTWSLGVEEQFYIFFPISFLILIYFFRNNFKFISYFFIILILLGIIFTFSNQDDIKLTFYSPLFRFWQFLFGSTIFLISLYFDYKNKYLSYFFISGVFFISLSGNFFDNFQKVLLVTIFSSLLIFFSKDKFFFNNNVLSKCILVLGNISYSFYLWHLPIIYFYDLYYDESIFRAPIVFLISILISISSYHYVENKFRYFNFKISKKYFSIAALLLFCFISIFYVLKDQKNFSKVVKYNLKNFFNEVNYLEQKFNFSERTVFYKFSINDFPIYKHCTQNSKIFNINEDGLRTECLNSNDKDKLFFIIGNSHTANFIPMFDKLREKINFYYLHHDLLSNKDISDLLFNVSKKYKKIIFVTNVSNDKYLNFFFDNISKTEKYISGLIVGPIPNLHAKQEPLKCLIKQKDCYYDSNKDKKNRGITKLYNDINEKINSREREIILYLPYNEICPTEICYSYNLANDLITHRDNGHLTKEGSELLVDSFYKYLKKLELL
tara:strand:- start:1989 stop:3878 length:1890 start_codon:yes stop_codon:yes gene_type:complete